jgi:hypothetical protein
MYRIVAPRAESGLLLYLLCVAAGAAVIACVLYYLMRATVLPNPGLSAYKTPTTDPIIPRTSKDADILEAYGLSIAAAKEQNELLGLDGPGTTPAVAAAPGPERKAVPAKEQKPQRAVRTRRRESPPDPTRAWAHRSYGLWNFW